LNASMDFCLSACGTSPSSLRNLYPSPYMKSSTKKQISQSVFFSSRLGLPIAHWRHTSTVTHFGQELF
jgi:hypothetical protein